MRLCLWLARVASSVLADIGLKKNKRNRRKVVAICLTIGKNVCMTTTSHTSASSALVAVIEKRMEMFTNGIGESAESNTAIAISAHRLLPITCEIIGSLPNLSQETINAYLWQKSGKPRPSALVYQIDGERYLVAKHPTYKDDLSESETEIEFSGRAVSGVSVERALSLYDNE